MSTRSRTHCPISGHCLLASYGMAVQLCVFCGLEWIDGEAAAWIWGPHYPFPDHRTSPNTQPQFLATCGVGRLQLADGVRVSEGWDVLEWDGLPQPCVKSRSDDVLYVLEKAPVLCPI